MLMHVHCASGDGDYVQAMPAPAPEASGVCGLFRCLRCHSQLARVRSALPTATTLWRMHAAYRLPHSAGMVSSPLNPNGDLRVPMGQCQPCGIAHVRHGVYVSLTA